VAITQESIAGATLGLRPQAYKDRFGGWRAQSFVAADRHYTSLAFQQPEVAVYFPPRSNNASVITTWNPSFKTAKGVGPCSTIAEVRKAYGDDIKPSFAGTSPDGTMVFSWVVGNRLLFGTQDQRTIHAVALYRGSPTEKHLGGPQSYANFFLENESACISR